MEEKESRGIGYKIEEGKKYLVYRSEHNGKTFYKIQTYKMLQDGTKEVGYKNIRFKSNVDLPDRTWIIPKAGFEDFYNKDKYTTIYTLFITDFEIEGETVNSSDAISEYNNKINSQIDNDAETFFQQNNDNIDINEDDLPF